jgi:hypothetical protein
MKYNVLLVLTITVSMICCKDKATDATNVNDMPVSEKDSKLSTAEKPAAAAPAMPFMSSEQINDLYAATDNVDIIFYELPASVSQDDPASAKNSVLYIFPAAPTTTSPCAAIGRLTWMSKGEIIKEADVHVADGCTYLVFMENSKPVASNALSVEGISFFRNIINQVSKFKQ